MPQTQDKRLENIRRKRQSRQTSEIADWGGADAALIRDCIEAVAAMGGAIRFGYTRDQGAYAVGIYLSNDHYTEYIRPADDVDSYLRGLALDMADIRSESRNGSDSGANRHKKPD